MRRLVLAVTCLTVLPRIVPAAPLPCTIEVATNRVVADDVLRRGSAASAEMPMLRELDAIARKAPDAHRAIGDQLAPRDAARFAEVSQQLRLMQLSAYVESAHARDATVVERMFLAARKSYADPAFRPADDDVPGTVLFVLRSALQKDEPWSPSAEVGCTVDTALAREEGVGDRRVNAFAPMLHRDTLIMQRLRAQYGLALLWQFKLEQG